MDRSFGGVFRLMLVIVVLCMTLAGGVCLFYVFSPNQSASFPGLPAAYTDAPSITFIIASLLLAPLLNVLSYFSKRMSLVLLSAGLASSLSPLFIVQLGWVASCENGTNDPAACANLGTDQDIDIALAGYCLLMFAVFFSFMVCPGRLRNFGDSPTARIFLLVGFFLGTLSIVAAVLNVVRAAELQEDGTWKPEQSSFVATAVENFIAVLFFYSALLIRNLPLGYATLFYLASYYPLPLLSALRTQNIPVEDAAGALGYTGIVLMALFLLHRHFFHQLHHADGDEDPDLHSDQLHHHKQYDTLV